MKRDLPGPRSPKGSTVILYIAISLMIVCPLIILIAHLSWLLAEQSRIQAALDSAALQAADTLSRVTISDEKFGFVSLSNVAPIGTATHSKSGQPLPVIGFNTLVGTVRLGNLMSQELDSVTFRKLAQVDADNLMATTQVLNLALAKAMSGSPNNSSIDWNGAKLDGYNAAKMEFLKNSGSDTPQSTNVLQKFDIALGRAKNAVGTGIPIPTKQENKLSNLNNANYYCPFQDYALAGKHFIFAAVGPRASLCSVSDFLPPDSSQLSSIVKVSATVMIKDPILAATPLGAWLGDTSTITFASCAKPGSLPDTTPPGVLTIQFANGQIPSVAHLRDILSSSDLNSKSAELLTSVNGTFPDDAASSLVTEEDSQITAESVLATALYDWLRNQHCRPNLLTASKVLNYNFNNQSGKLVCIFEISPTGELLVHSTSNYPFSFNSVSECQFLAQCNSTGNFPCQLLIRDQVHKLGVTAGGKEGGQPLVGDPVNWCELPDFGESAESATTAGKGAKFLNVVIEGPQSSKWLCPGAISPVGVVFKNLKRNNLQSQPNPSFYSGGLAVDISIASG